MKDLTAPSFRKNGVKTGQSLVEYGLLLALVTAVCITAIQLFGGNLATLMNGMASSIVNSTTGG